MRVIKNIHYELRQKLQLCLKQPYFYTSDIGHTSRNSYYAGVNLGCKELLEIQINNITKQVHIINTQGYFINLIDTLKC